jgi:hypothetical protein
MARKAVVAHIGMVTMFLTAWGLFAVVLVGRATAGLLIFFDARPLLLTGWPAVPSTALLLLVYGGAILLPFFGLLGFLTLVGLVLGGRRPVAPLASDVDGG